MEKKIICIQCPIGCIIEVKGKDEIAISGHECKRGKNYAHREIQNPMRILTTTVRIEDGIQNMLPVRSEKAMPKSLLKKCIKKMAEVKVKAPVHRGQIICSNILKKNIKIVASRNMKKKEP